MSIPSNNQDSRQSALKDGIVIGVIATLKELGLKVNSASVWQVLHYQQKWSNEEIEYFTKFFGVN